MTWLLQVGGTTITVNSFIMTLLSSHI